MKIKDPNAFGTLTQEELTAFENKHSFRLPDDYRQFLLKHNGGEPDPDTIDFIEHGIPASSDIALFYGIHDGENWAQLEWHLNIYKGRIIHGSLPIAGDSGGNQYVLIVQGPKSGHIYFWDHEEETELAGHDNMSYIASSFVEFAEKLYEYVAPDETEVKRIVRENDLVALKKQLDSGYDIETLDEYNRTLIENAAIHNRTGMIHVLFDRGATLKNALELARMNFKFFPEHKESVDLLEELTKLRTTGSN